MSEDKKTCENCVRTSEVLEVKLSSLSLLIEEKIGNLATVLNEVKEQTTRTNGRVSSLEKWRSYIMGALGIVGFAIMYLFQSK